MSSVRPVSQTREHWGVLGGGLLGAIVALRLARAGRRVSLLTTDDAETCQTATRGDDPPARWQEPQHLLDARDEAARALIDELGLGGAVRWSPARCCVWSAGGRHPLNSALDFARLPLLGLIDKTRLGAALLYMAGIEDGRPLEAMPAREWLSRLSGATCWTALWEPLLGVHLGADADRVSAAFPWSLVRRMAQARSIGWRAGSAGSVPGGTAGLEGMLDRALRAERVEVGNADAIMAIAPAGQYIMVTAADGERRFDKVVLAIPAGDVVRLCPALTAAERAGFGAIDSRGLLTATLLLRRPSSGCVATHVLDRSVAWASAIELSSFDPALAGTGRGLLRMERRLATADTARSAPLADLEHDAREALHRLFPAIGADGILAMQIERRRDAGPLLSVGYSRRLPPMATSVRGLFVVNSAYIRAAAPSLDDIAALADGAVPVLLAGSGDHQARAADIAQRVA
jgi:protoporphyrinogen oxidase